MTLMIDLAPDEEIDLKARAAMYGQDPASYTLKLLRRDLEAMRGTTPDISQNPADFWEGYIGVFDSRETNGEEISYLARDSEKEFGAYLDEKKRQGRI